MNQLVDHIISLPVVGKNNKVEVRKFNISSLASGKIVFNPHMSKDEFTAIWVSHSSIGDYLKCPRGYYLKNVYKNPLTNKKMSIMSPALALGQAVHEVVESLSVLPVDDRLKIPLDEKFNQVWSKVTGQKGGFKDDNQEQEIKARGMAMLDRITKNPPGAALFPAVGRR